MTILGRYHFAEKSRDWEVKGGALMSAYVEVFGCRDAGLSTR
jgi:hypothetical protein